MTGYSPEEIKIFRKLDSPKKIQDFLNSLKINFEEKGETCMSPRKVLRAGKAHCMEGAMLAAAILEFHGYKPLVMDLRAQRPDDDHVVCLFRQFGCWGAIGKTNHAVLRYREPVYKTLRELALSYFHEYFTNRGKKTLREYSAAVNLNRFNYLKWRVSERDLFLVPKRIDKEKHFAFLSRAQIKNLRLADKIEILSGRLTEYSKRKSGKRGQ